MAIGLRVEDSAVAFDWAIELGAKAAEQKDYAIPAIRGVGASIIYLVDEVHELKLFASFRYTANKFPPIVLTCPALII